MVPDQWIERYRRAWETADADEVVDLFTPDASYRSSVFREPFLCLIESGPVSLIWSAPGVGVGEADRGSQVGVGVRGIGGGVGGLPTVPQSARGVRLWLAGSCQFQGWDGVPSGSRPNTYVDAS